MPDESPEGAPAAATTDSPPKATEPKEVKMLQSDFDKIVADRVAQERKKYTDYEDLKAKAAKLAEIEKSKLDDTERLAAELAEAKSKADSLSTELKSTKINASLTKAAADLKAVDADAVVRLLDTSQLEVDANGNVTNAAEVVKALLDSKPYLVAAAVKPPPIDQGYQGGQGPDGKLPPEQLAQQASALGIRLRSV